jgi:hypothetical protein
LRGALSANEIGRIRDAAAAFYAVAEKPDHPTFPRSYLYNPGNMAVSMAALDDYGTADYLLLRTVASSPAAVIHLRRFLGDDVLCSLTHSRMRKSYPQSASRVPRPSTRDMARRWGSDRGLFQCLYPLDSVHAPRIASTRACKSIGLRLYFPGMAAKFSSVRGAHVFLLRARTRGSRH